MKPSALLFCMLCLPMALQLQAEMTAEQAFDQGKSFAQSEHGASAIQNAITTGDQSEKVPNYATTHAHSGLFMGGDGDTFTPGANRVSECKTTIYSDQRKQVECDAINDVAGYKTTRPKMEIKPTDPIVTKARHVGKNAIEVLKRFGWDIKQEEKQCTEKTVETPAQYRYETCTVLREFGESKCVIGRKIEIDADSNFQCERTATSLTSTTRTKNVGIDSCTIGRVINIDADSNFQCEKTMNAYETYKCQRWIDVSQVCDTSIPTNTEVITESYWWCGDSCYFPRENEGIGAFRKAASRAGNTVSATQVTSVCENAECIEYGYDYSNNIPYCVSYSKTCYNTYTVVASGGAPITLKQDSYTFGTGHVLTYDDRNGVCLGGICTWKVSKKPMVYFVSSHTGECTEKVWVPPHHKGRYPGHWACKNTAAVLTCPSGYALETTPDGNKTCLGNCRWNVKHNSNCGMLESLAVP